MLIKQFIRDKVYYADPEFRTPTSLLYAAYYEYCWTDNEKIPESRRCFTTAMKAQGFEYAICAINGKSTRCFKGVVLRSQDDQDGYIPTHVLVPQAARMAGVTPKAIYHWIRDGKVTDARKLSERKTLVSVSEIFELTGRRASFLPMVRVAERLLFQEDALDARDELRNAVLAPWRQWRRRIKDIITDNIAVKAILEGLL
jgi:hypothetical protein